MAAEQSIFSRPDYLQWKRQNPQYFPEEKNQNIKFYAPERGQGTSEIFYQPAVQRPIPATPVVAQPTPAATTPSVKIARPDIILQNDSEIPIEIMTDLVFEDIGGQEIINISRNDLINGQNVVYQPIKNVAAIAAQYNSKNIISLGSTLNNHFNNYAIKLEEKIPYKDPSEFPDYSPVYFEGTSLVLEFVGLNADEQVEVQIMTSGNILDDTIYMES